MKETSHVLCTQFPAIVLFCKPVVHRAVDRIKMFDISITTGLPHVII